MKITSFKIVALCLMLLLTNFTHAQNIGKIEGQLTSTSNNKPIVFGTVALHSLPDSILVTGITTDTTGHFEFNNLAFGTYVLECRSVGFNNRTKGDLQLSSKTPSVSLPNITMEEKVVDIEEVIIVGERLKGTAKVDKTIYPVSEKAASVSNSGLELLRLVPAVQVDFAKNVSIEGSPNIQIYVDDKIRDKNYLAQLDPKTVDRIEVMTNPSMKYGADVSGVINIKLKKKRKGGISGGFGGEQSLNMSAFYTDFRVNIEYGTSKFRVYASGMGDYQKFKVNYSGSRKALDGVSEYIQQSEGKDAYGWSGIHYGADWFVNDKNTFNFYGYSSPKSGLTTRTNETKEWLTNGSTSKYLINSPSKQSGSDKAGYYGVFYKRTFEKPAQELIFDANYFLHNNAVDNTYNEQYFFADKHIPNGALQARTENLDNFKEALYVKVDYTHPVAEKVKLDVGYQNNTKWNKNTFSNSSDAVVSNFKYYEIRHAAYANLSGQLKAFSWQAGLRYESSNIEIDEQSNTIYNSWLPQMSLQQKINDKQSVKLSFRRSIQRPGIAQLNPFFYTIDSLNISRGNPNLKPSYLNKLELSYPIQQGSNYFSPGVYVNYFSDVFEPVKIVTGNTSETYFDNIGKGIEYGINFSGSLNVSKWCVLYPYLSLFKKDLNEIPEYNIDGTDKIAYQVSLYTIFTLPRQYSISNYFTYGSPTISGQNTIEHGSVLVLGINKQLFKNDAGKISLITFNPFNTRYLMHETETKGNNFSEVSKRSLLISNYWAIQFSYNFQQGGDKIKKLNYGKNEPIERGKGLL